MNKRYLWMSAAAALVVAAALAGCGTTTYFAGRPNPPSGLPNRVLITIQYPTASIPGGLEIVDAYYDIRYKYNSTSSAPAYAISGLPTSSLPWTIQNMPEEQLGAVYSSSVSSGNITLVNYATESSPGTLNNLIFPTPSAFITRNQAYAFAASQEAGVLSVSNRTTGGGVSLSLPGVYRVSVNPSSTVALVFVQNDNHVYYPRALTAGQTVNYSGGPGTWPKAAVDCEPQQAPAWCLFQAQSPDHTDATGNYYGAPLTFDRPIKAVFSADGGTAYVLNCGPECGGTTASVSPLPVAPLNFLLGQQSGMLSTESTLSTICTTANSPSGCTLPIPGGASNALVNGSTMYVVGQELMTDYCGSSSNLCWGGELTMVTLPTGSATTAMTASAPISISDGTPNGPSRMVLADDNTLWIGMTGCSNGERANNNLPYGCLTMFNTSTNAVTLMPYNSDATGIAAITGLHKIYTAEGGKVYIYATGGTYAAGTAINSDYVTPLSGMAYDVAYMDATSDSDNTVY